MTLTEYLAQTDPVRMPDVVLEEGEYEIFNTVGMKPFRFTHVYLPSVKGSYSVKEGDTTLYTQDQFGQPKNRSCFSLPHPLEDLEHYERVGDSHKPQNSKNN